jgi:hypothetical protein
LPTGFSRSQPINDVFKLSRFTIRALLLCNSLAKSNSLLSLLLVQMSMRQQFHPAARQGVVSQLKINPDRPIRPFATDSSSKHHTPPVSNSESLLSETKAPRNSPETPLMTSDRTTSVHQSASLPKGKKRPIEKAVSSGSASKRKAKWSTTRRSSKTLEPNGNIYKDQECNLGTNSKKDDSQSPEGVDIAKYDRFDSSNDTTYSDPKSKHLHHGGPEGKPHNTTTYVRGNSDAEIGSAEGQIHSHSSNRAEVDYAKINVPHRMANRITVHAERSNQGSQESTSSRYSPEEIHSTIENGELVEGSGDVYQTPVKKVIGQNTR